MVSYCETDNSLMTDVDICGVRAYVGNSPKTHKLYERDHLSSGRLFHGILRVVYGSDTKINDAVVKFKIHHRMIHLNAIS